MGEHFEELLSQATNFLSSSLWRKTENVFLCTQSRGENVWKAVKSRYENVCSCWPYRQSDINNPTKQVTGRKVLFTEVSHSFLSRIWEPEVGGQRELKIDVRSESQSQLENQRSTYEVEVNWDLRMEYIGICDEMASHFLFFHSRAWRIPVACDG